MKSSFRVFNLLVFYVLVTFASCSKLEPSSPADEDVLDGPVAGLSYEESAQFLRGDANVNEIFTSQSGLVSPIHHSLLISVLNIHSKMNYGSAILCMNNWASILNKSKLSFMRILFT